MIDGFKEDFETSIKGFPDKYEVVEEVGERHIFLKDPAILKYLKDNGIETDEPVEVVFVQHRNLQNKIVSCYRFEGQERLDSEWIKSGCATMQAVISSSKDDSMRFALRSMSAEVSRERGFE
ncbi:hypothetical protein [Pseudomonas sp. P8_250]|uniref:hypothetical protein n=1 Tax=Pseudomonas sp. P8_250 TaxID=3043446 RepID=UPI002A36B03F|nr:hypothetical protein [Pseudomonas sp. P8_250]MDX9668698.1 hypothetical protein [Pseudomonas sp. P8_250]